jgi:hypothetical protein
VVSGPRRAGCRVDAACAPAAPGTASSTSECSGSSGVPRRTSHHEHARGDRRPQDGHRRPAEPREKWMLLDAAGAVSRETARAPATRELGTFHVKQCLPAPVLAVLPCADYSPRPYALHRLERWTGESVSVPRETAVSSGVPPFRSAVSRETAPSPARDRVLSAGPPQDRFCVRHLSGPTSVGALRRRMSTPKGQAPFRPPGSRTARRTRRLMSVRRFT